jgi:uncharacterized protein YdhG (YjbR/CyaY superfamily)
MGEPAQEGTMSAKKATQKSAKSTTAINKKSKGFTDEERAAMKERAQELKAEARRGRRADKADGESAVLAKIAEMPRQDRAMAKRLHAIIKASAPALSPKTWYGMPAYAKDGKVVCFFQSAEKFNSRYATFGFSDVANLDEGAMWPTSFALKELTAAEKAKIGALVKKEAPHGSLAGDADREALELFDSSKRRIAHEATVRLEALHLLERPGDGRLSDAKARLPGRALGRSAFRGRSECPRRALRAAH